MNIVRKLTVAFLALLMVSCGLSGPQTAAEHITEARAALQQRKPQTALIHLRNAIEIAPDDPEVRFELSSLFLLTGKPGFAEIEIKKALEQGVGHAKGNLLLAKAYLNQGKLEACGNVLASVDAEKAGELARDFQVVRGRLLLAEREYEAAREHFKSMLSSAPEDLDARLGLAQLAVLDGKTEDAKKILESILADDGTFADAWSLKGGLAFYENDFQAAVDDYTKSINNKFSIYNELWGRSLAYIATGKLDEALADASAMSNIIKGGWRENYINGVVSYLRGDIDSAHNNFLEVSKVNPGFRPVLSFLGQTYLARAEFNSAENFLEKSFYLYPDDTRVALLLAIAKIQLKDLAGAEDLVASVLGKEPGNKPALELQAALSVIENDPKQAETALEKLAKQGGGVGDLYLSLGMLQVGQGKSTEGISNLLAAKELSPKDLRPTIGLIVEYLRQGDYQAALKEAEDLERSAEGRLDAGFYKAVVLVEMARFDEAKAILDSIWSGMPGHLGAGRSLALLAVGHEKDTEKAIEYYKVLIANHPKESNLHFELAYLYKNIGRLGEYLTELQNALALNAGHMQARTDLMRYYHLTGALAKAEDLLNQSPPEANKSDAFLEVSCYVYEGRKRYSEAEKCLTELVARNPADYRPVYQLANFHKRTNKLKEALKEYSFVIKQEPDLIKAYQQRFEVATLLGDAESAQHDLAHLNKAFPEQPETLQANVFHLIQQNKFQEAIPAQERLLAKSPTPDNIYRLAILLGKTGDNRKLIEFSTAWLDRRPELLLLVEMQGNAYLELEDYTQAKASYEELLGRRPDYLPALVNLALLNVEERPGVALSYADRARAIAPQAARVLDVVGWVYFKNGRTDEAAKMLEQAFSRLPNSVSVRHHYGLVLISRGAVAEGRAILEPISALDFRGAEEVRRVLSTLQ